MGDFSINRYTLAGLFFGAYLLIFLEAAFGGARRWVGAQVDLLPVLMVYAGLHGRMSLVSLLAFFAGLCFDSLSINPLGVSVLPLFFVGLMVHMNREVVLKDSAFAQTVLGFLACAAAPILTLILLFGMGHRPLAGTGLLWQWTVMTVGGAVLAPLVFWCFNRLNAAFSYPPLVEAPFRQDRELKRGRGLS